MQNIESRINICPFPVCLADKTTGGKAQIPGESHPALVCRNPPKGATQGGMGMQAVGFDVQRGSEGQVHWGLFAENLLGSLAASEI